MQPLHFFFFASFLSPPVSIFFFSFSSVIFGLTGGKQTCRLFFLSQTAAIFANLAPTICSRGAKFLNKEHGRAPKTYTSNERTTKFPTHSTFLKRNRKTCARRAQGKTFRCLSKQGSTCLEIRLYDVRSRLASVAARLKFLV